MLREFGDFVRFEFHAAKLPCRVGQRQSNLKIRRRSFCRAGWLERISPGNKWRGGHISGRHTMISCDEL